MYEDIFMMITKIDVIFFFLIRVTNDYKMNILTYKRRMPFVFSTEL